jgi:hypothetical protein
MARGITHKKKKISNDPSFRKLKPLDWFPVQRHHTLSAVYSGPLPATPTAYGDVGAIMSRANSRMYRFGKLYRAKFDLDINATPGTRISVMALANTWYVQKAYEEAKLVFDQAYENERENINRDQRARWFDFRCRFSGLASSNSYDVAAQPWLFPTVASLANPGSIIGGAIQSGQIVDSLVEDSAGVTRFFTWNDAAGFVGVDEYSVMDEYQLAGNQDRTPDVATGDMPYSDLEADSSAVEGSALQTRGQDPPYQGVGFPNLWVKVGELEVLASGGTRLSTGFVDLPCGVFSLTTNVGNIAATLINGDLSIEVASGNYKGVRAHNMERMP